MDRIDALHDPGQRTALVRHGKECAHGLPVVRRHAETPRAMWSSVKVHAVRSPARRCISGPRTRSACTGGTRTAHERQEIGKSARHPLALQDMERLRGGNGEDGKRRIERPAGRHALGPGEKGGRAHIVLPEHAGVRGRNECSGGERACFFEEARDRHRQVSDGAVTVGLTRAASCQKEIGKSGHSPVHQSGAQTKGYQAQVRPGAGDAVDGRRGDRIVIAAGAQAATAGMDLVGSEPDRIVGHRREAVCGEPLREPDCRMGLCQYMRHDSVAHRRLVGVAARSTRSSRRAEPPGVRRPDARARHRAARPEPSRSVRPGR